MHIANSREERRPEIYSGAAVAPGMCVCADLP